MNTDDRDIYPATERRVSEALEVDDKDHIVIHDDQAVPHLAEKSGAPKAVGTAVIDITHTIPTTGLRKVTTKWEYWTYCAFFFGADGAPMAFAGSSQLQLFLTLQFPDGMVKWGPTTLPINSFLLDLTGIIFAVQFVALLIIGAYADYGKWRPWVLVGFTGMLYICQFAIATLNKPSQWFGAQVCYVAGITAMNMMVAFYAATFPGIVQDLPEVIQSEKDVLEGTREPAVHDEFLSYQRAKLQNLLNVTASSLKIITSCIAIGISVAIGSQTESQLLQSYRVLIGFLAACTVLATMPFFVAQQHRPGQQVPDGTPMWKAGMKQVYSAARSVRYLKQCGLYLIAYFMLQETYGTYYSVVGILQNDAINYSPTLLNGMNVVGSVCGGSGNLFIYLMQRKFRFSVKAGVFYGASMTIIPNLWGAIGAGQKTIGFHHEWEFWLAQAWNFQMASWASYQIAFLAEVVPTPKAYLFFALFNTVGRTSGFVGPFVSSAIINASDGNTNMAFIFLVSMGSIGLVVLWFVDPSKAKLDNARYLEREAQELYSEEQRRQVVVDDQVELTNRD